MNLFQWISRSISIIIIMWSDVHGEMTCDIEQPCQLPPLVVGRSIEQACLEYGCCYATDPQTAFPSCYKKMIRYELRPLDVNWQTTRASYGPNPQFGEHLLHGGETDFPGSQLVKKCHPLFKGGRCFPPWLKVNKEKCERSHCCWSSSGCYKSKLHITYLRKRCPPGFKNPPRCEDFNECNGSPCDPNAECTNTEGSFECECNDGYIGDGFSCADINECNENPCDPNAECMNTDGSFECECNDDYFGDGFDCADVYDCSQVVGDVVINQVPGKEFVCSNGWTVFQRRIDGSIPDFHRKTWEEYAAGFGSLNGEFWLGLRTLHLITKDNSCKLRVDLESFDGDTAYAEYSRFLVGDESDMFRVGVGGNSGTAGDSLVDPSRGYAIIDGQQFSTVDRDNDRWSSGSCADFYNTGGYWANFCAAAAPNGRYGQTPLNSDDFGMYWFTFKSYDRLKSVQLGVQCD